MRITTYNVYDRRIVWAEGTSITGNENVDKFHFEFDPEWDEFEAKFMVLIVNGTSYIDQLDAENNVTLRNVVYDKENVEFGVYGIDTDTSAKLSTNIIGIETTESIWGRIRDVSDLPSKTQWEIYTEEMLALLAQGSITLEACQQALTDTLSAKNTTKGYMDTTEGYKNTTKGYMDTTEGYKQDTAGLKQDTINIVTEFNSNVEQKTTDFNNNASSKTTAFNNNASSKTNDFNSNYTDKLGTFNSNATSKTTDFNDNASSKTTTFNSNASSKTTTFNNNASSKTDDYNSNATSKTTAFNENYTEKYNAVTLAGTTAVGNVQTAENTAITNIETAGSSYDARINDLLNQIPVGTVEDAYINVQDSSDLPLKDIQVEGNTYQLQTTGKNKLDTSDWVGGYIDSSGVFHRGANTNATFNKFISVNANTSYTVSSNANVRNFAICEYNSNQEFIQRTISSNTVSSLTVTTTENTGYVKVVFNHNNSTEVTQTIIDYRDIQFEIGSSRTTYEPYTGGIPSPNPDLPQNIKVVTGNNTVNVVGKNLLNTNIMQPFTAKNTNWTSADGIEQFYNTTNIAKSDCWFQLIEGQKYTFSVQKVENIYNDDTQYIQLIDENNVQIITLNPNTNYVTFTSSRTRRAYPRFRTKTANEQAQLVVQLEKGETKTDFEPYQGQSQLLSLGSMEFAGIGEYKDFLFHAVNGNKYYDSLTAEQKATLTYGKWYKHNVIGKTTYTGSASESWTSATSTLAGTTRFYITNNNVITNSNGSDTNIYVLANSLTGMSFKDLYNGNGVANAISNYTGSNLNHRFNVRIETSIASDVTAFKTWLASNNLVVYFVLQTPVDEEITDTTLIEQLDALYDLQTYKNVTNIFTTTDNEVPILNVTYRKDLQTLTDKIALLEARVELLES